MALFVPAPENWCGTVGPFVSTIFDCLKNRWETVDQIHSKLLTAEIAARLSRKLGLIMIRVQLLACTLVPKVSSCTPREIPVEDKPCWHWVAFSVILNPGELRHTRADFLSRPDGERRSAEPLQPYARFTERMRSEFQTQAVTRSHRDSMLPAATTVRAVSNYSRQRHESAPCLRAAKVSGRVSPATIITGWKREQRGPWTHDPQRRNRPWKFEQLSSAASWRDPGGTPNRFTSHENARGHTHGRTTVAATQTFISRFWSTWNHQRRSSREYMLVL